MDVVISKLPNFAAFIDRYKLRIQPAQTLNQVIGSIQDSKNEVILDSLIGATIKERLAYELLLIRDESSIVGKHGSLEFNIELITRNVDFLKGKTGLTFPTMILANSSFLLILLFIVIMATALVFVFFRNFDELIFFGATLNFGIIAIVFFWVPLGFLLLIFRKYVSRQVFVDIHTVDEFFEEMIRLNKFKFLDDNSKYLKEELIFLLKNQN